MFRGVILPILWFPISGLLLFANIALLSHRSEVYYQKNQPLIAFARESSEIIETYITKEDARVLLLEKFFRSYKSPLESYASQFITVSDAYNIDWKLMPAISLCESLGGKRIPESVGFNPFGIMVFTGQNFGKKFTDWNHAIDWTGQLIKDKYIAYGLTTPLLIGPKWAPPSVENGNSWAHCVQSFMDKIL